MSSKDRKVFIMNNQAVNPYLPSWEYIPDGEPYVFDDRVYIYGSHDKFNGDVYCMLDYVCWSASVDNLAEWRYEGVIYRKDQDPANGDLQGNLYAPDVCKGSDGRYYLYYVLSNLSIVSVAVCDEPAGKYEFYGYVHYEDGVRLGEKEGDEPQFDPGVLLENGNVYMYTGYCPLDDDKRHGAMCTVLDTDMLTVKEGPQFVIPNKICSKGGEYEGHAFFEAPSIRKKGDTYFLIYSTELNHELAYATSKEPTKNFKYQGVLVSNGDLNIDSYKPGAKPMCYCANNHGSMVKIKDDWYIFYHRHTNGTNYSRQACFEILKEREDGLFYQSEITSNHGMKPLIGQGEYPAYIACHLYNDLDVTYIPWSGWMDDRFQKITQEGGDGDESVGYVANLRKGCGVGFKYFELKNVKSVSVYTKGYATGKFELRTAYDGEAIASFDMEYSNVWREYKADVNIEDGVYALYFVFMGEGHMQFRSFAIECG